MNSKSFDTIVDFRIKRIREVLKSKGKEYASDTDRLHNFKVAARVDNTSPEDALWGMALKHLISKMDIIEATKKDNFNISWNVIEEKILDSINYDILLFALLKERIINASNKS